jgi:hypothetical protein
MFSYRHDSWETKREIESLYVDRGDIYFKVLQPFVRHRSSCHPDVKPVVSSAIIPSLMYTLCHDFGVTTQFYVVLGNCNTLRRLEPPSRNCFKTPSATPVSHSVATTPPTVRSWNSYLSSPPPFLNLPTEVIPCRQEMIYNTHFIYRIRMLNFSVPLPRVQHQNLLSRQITSSQYLNNLYRVPRRKAQRIPVTVTTN